MGTVWLGHDELLDRRVAVKEVRVAEGLSPQERDAVLERQLREARICARLNHPSIVTVHDVIQQDDRPWVVMELIEGRGLDAVVRDEGPLELEQVADVGYQALDALGHAHAAGVLHRDIKPSNIMLTADGGIIITDFGIATLEGEVRLTQEGGVIGSPGYLAPEQVQGEDATSASDVWALGATLYFLAEGRPAFQRGTAAATALAPVTSDPDPPERSLPLWPLLSEMLERNAEARPSVGDAQSRLADYDPSSAHAPAPPESRDYHTGPRPSHAAAAPLPNRSQSSKDQPSSWIIGPK
jgi:eukaryotic-like serine/threonine-protein kinase